MATKIGMARDPTRWRKPRAAASTPARSVRNFVREQLVVVKGRCWTATGAQRNCLITYEPQRLPQSSVAPWDLFASV